MSSSEDALLFLDLDKGRGSGAEERRRLDKDPRLRAGWLQYQALQALALEAAPVPGERMTREVLARCRREQVERRLAGLTGGDELARELLLEGAGSRGRFPVWLAALALAGLLVLGWLAWRGFGIAPGGRGTADTTALSGGGSAASLPFEFPVQTPPADAALAGPTDDDSDSDSDADDVHDEAPAARQASRLLRETLHAAQERELASPSGAATKAPAAPAVQPAAANASRPALSPLSSAAALPPLPVAARSPAPLTGTAALGPGLTLSSDSLAAEILAAPDGATDTAADAGPLDIQVDLPQRRDIDVRLFRPSGLPARVLASGPFGPGSVHFSLDARDSEGQILAPGTYYLRVMTPWFSRVEPIQIH